MNRFFLSLGVLMLLALTTALVAPRFIDWSNYTQVIEEQASRLLGRDVHVSGAVDLRLLPMPRITFSDVEIASRQDGSQPEVEIARMEALLSLAPFLRGQAEIVELTLDQPVIRLTAIEAASDGAQEALDLSAVRVEEATIRDGRVERIGNDGQRQVLLDRFNASMSAPSLLGPWRVDPASAIIDGERVSLRVQSGSYNGDRRMRLRVSVLPVNRPLEITVDGHFDWSGEQARFEGQARANSLAVTTTGGDGDDTALTWRVDAMIDAALDELRAQNIELLLGQAGDQAFVLNGHARVSLGERPAFNAALSSRQVDLDRMLGGGPSEPVDLRAGWAAANTFVRWIDQATVPGDVSFDIPAIVLGGSVIRDIGFDAIYQPGLPLALDDLVATFPGETRFGFSGAVGPAEREGLALDGVMSLASEAPDVFVGWSTGRSDEGGTFSQLSDVAVSGRIVADHQEVALERLRGEIDGSALSGLARFTAPLDEETGGHLVLNLDAGRFDFGLLSGLGTWLTADGEDGLRIDSVDARLAVDALVAGAEDLGEVDVSLSATPDRIRIDQLTIGDAAGAQLAADGYWDRGAVPPIGALSFNVDVERLRGLVRLVRDALGDHPLLADLERNAGLYEPASLVGTYVHDAEAGLQLGVDGTLGQSAVEVSGLMPPQPGDATLPDGLTVLFERPAELTWNVESPDAFALIGQLGIAALPIDQDSEGSFSGALISDGDDLPQVRLAFDGLDAALRLQGELRRDDPNGPVSGMRGDGSIFVGDVANLGLMAGLALPGLFEPIAASAGFDIVFDLNSRLANLTGLQGDVAEVPVAGSVQIERGPLGLAVDAQLNAERADLRGLLAGLVGPSAFDQGFSQTWPEGPLAFNQLPFDLRLQLSTPRLSIWDEITGLDANLDLQAREAEIVLDRLSAELFGGDLDARLSLRDADRGTLATGRLALSNTDLSSLSWQRDGQPVVRGEGSMAIRFESSGVSMASLMAGLTGEGTVEMTQARLSGLGLDGFARILQASDAGLLTEDADLESAFADALQAGSMQIDQANSPISLAGGIARASNLFVQGASTALRGSWSVDLSTSDLDADFSYAATDGPGDVASMPNVGLSFTGNVSAPEQQLDVSQVASFLNVRQLENEIRRVEALNAEIIERERLLRLMAASELDQARLDAVEQQRLQEAERLEAERLEAERLEAERLEQERLEREAAEEAARQAAAAQAEAEAAAEEAARLAEEAEAEAARQAEEAAALEQERLELERLEREEALRRALQAREAEEVRPPLSVDLPPLGAPINVESNPVRDVNPLSLGENPPAATSGPLILAPLDLSPPN